MIGFLNRNMDKLLHFLACFFIVVSAYVFRHLWLSIVLASIAGMGKEVYDHISSRSFDWKDLIADAVGIIVGALVLIAIR